MDSDDSDNEEDFVIPRDTVNKRTAGRVLKAFSIIIYSFFMADIPFGLEVTVTESG